LPLSHCSLAGNQWIKDDLLGKNTDGLAQAISRGFTDDFATHTGEQILVTQNMTELDLIAGASQPLRFEHPIPKLLVQVPEVLEASAVSANEILLTGLKPGISKLTVVDNQGNTQTLSVSVNIDVRPLQRTINKVLPASQVTATGLTNRVVLSGYLPDAEQVSLVTQLAYNSS